MDEDVEMIDTPIPHPTGSIYSSRHAPKNATDSIYSLNSIYSAEHPPKNFIPSSRCLDGVCYDKDGIPLKPPSKYDESNGYLKEGSSWTSKVFRDPQTGKDNSIWSSAHAPR